MPYIIKCLPLTSIIKDILDQSFIIDPKGIYKSIIL